mmetsp:Transcript_4344/g.5003  ORF Transcript_4344/g.5003 Transcript_4344/m.5003 type:complete len:135 (+) Transcript_4344:871-1275(+)
MNIDYDRKEQRSIIERKRKKVLVGHDEPVLKRRKVYNLQIDRTKNMHIMEGEQLLQLMGQYSVKRVRKIPKDICKMMVVRDLKEKGISATNKLVKEETFQTKLLKMARSRGPPTAEKYSECAKENVSINDSRAT